MNLEEFLTMPMGMTIEEYQRLLKEKKRLESQIRKVSDVICIENDSLEVLSDEVGSDRYNKHLTNKQQADARKKKAQEKLSEINEKLKG